MKVLYFAWVRERVGKAEEELELPAHVTTVGQLMRWLAERGETYAEAFANPRIIRAALDGGVRYIGLVASRVRGASILDSLDLSEAERARVHTPVGLPIGAKTPAEIAVSIAAELVASIRRGGLSGDAAPAVPREALDPVCGMTVTIGPATEHLQLAGADYWFCGPGCRTAFANRPVGA